MKRGDKLLWALGISLGLHLAVLAAVVSSPPRPVPARPRPAELIIVEVTAPARPREERAESKDRPRLPPRSQPLPPRPNEADWKNDRPLKEEPAPLAVSPARSLLPSSFGSLSVVVAPPDGGVDDDRPRRLGPLPAMSANELVQRIAGETLGRGKVDRGLVHPYYLRLGKTLVKQWDADRVARAGLKGFSEQLVQNSKLWGEIWLERAEAFGRAGAAVNAPSTLNRKGAVANDRVGGLQGVDLEARREISKAMREDFKATRRATIRVVQDAEGKLVRVELLEPSNDSNVDREALADVRAAAEQLPVPPADALGDSGRLTSVWSFELIVSISPPVPTVAFEFDEVLGFVDARLPLDRRIYKKVRLVAVE